MLERAERAKRGDDPWQRTAGYSIDDVNQGQVDERSDKDVGGLLAEIREGHRAAIDALAAVDESMLAFSMPNWRGDGEIEVGEMLLLATAGHENNHLNDIERALDGR
jgi:hypothetical protein